MSGAGQLALDAEKVSAGPLGLLIIVLMIVATVLLIRSMNGRLRRLPPEFPPTVRKDSDQGAPPLD